jgi:hypothetical protein
MHLSLGWLAAAALSAHAFAPGSREHALARWVESEGGFVGDVACGESNGVRGLYATKDVPKGTLLLSVPEACCIAADEDPQWGLSLRELTTARLVGSRTRGEHALYIATLPSEQPLLCDWSDAELAELQSPRLADDARGMLPFLDESTARILPWTKDTEADVRWAERMVRSRAILCESGFNSLGDLDSAAMMALVPLLDLANHRTPNLGEVEPVSVDYAAKAITLAAPRDLKEGDEVTICYRYEGNEKLLLDYGFAEALDGQPCYEEINLGDELILDSTLADTCALDDLGVARFRELLQAPLAAPTTLAEDRAMLSESTTLEEGYGLLRAESARLFHALTYRIGQKALMTKMLEALESDNPAAALETVRLV